MTQMPLAQFLWMLLLREGVIMCPGVIVMAAVM